MNSKLLSLIIFASITTVMAQEVDEPTAVVTDPVVVEDTLPADEAVTDELNAGTFGDPAPALPEEEAVLPLEEEVQ